MTRTYLSRMSLSIRGKWGKVNYRLTSPQSHCAVL